MKKAEEMTVEELRDRLTPKKPIVKTKDWGEIRALAYCPTCGTLFFQNSDTFNEHCRDCGQALDWSEARENERLKYLFEKRERDYDLWLANMALFNALHGRIFFYKDKKYKFYQPNNDMEFVTSDGRRAWCIKNCFDNLYCVLVYVAGDAEPSWWCGCYIDESGTIRCKFTVPAIEKEKCDVIFSQMADYGFPQFTFDLFLEKIHGKYYEQDILNCINNPSPCESVESVEDVF